MVAPLILAAGRVAASQVAKQGAKRATTRKAARTNGLPARDISSRFNEAQYGPRGITDRTQATDTDSVLGAFGGSSRLSRVSNFLRQRSGQNIAKQFDVDELFGFFTANKASNAKTISVTLLVWVCSWLFWWLSMVGLVSLLLEEVSDEYVPFLGSLLIGTITPDPILFYVFFPICSIIATSSVFYVTWKMRRQSLSLVGRMTFFIVLGLAISPVSNCWLPWASFWAAGRSL